MEKVEFTRKDFTQDYEQYIRAITNPNGRGNAAYDMEKERKMPPQDILIEQRTIVHGSCGISCEFKWASGRQDAWVQLDVAEPSQEIIDNHQKLKESIKEKYGNGTRTTQWNSSITEYLQ